MYRLFDASSIPILLEVWRAASQGQPWTSRACRTSWAFWTSYRLNIHHEHFENCELFEHLEHFELSEHLVFWAAWAFWTSWAFWIRTRKQYKIVILCISWYRGHFEHCDYVKYLAFWTLWSFRTFKTLWSFWKFYCLNICASQAYFAFWCQTASEFSLNSI